MKAIDEGAEGSSPTTVVFVPVKCHHLGVQRRWMVPIATALSAALVTGLAGSLASQRAEASGRSAVGVAKRTDGSIVMVTVWCLGQRHENLHISRFDQDPTELIYVAAGISSEPITVHTIGHVDDGINPMRNQGLPSRGLLVAYNTGERSVLLGSAAYPSTAAVFAIDRLPVSDDPLPTDLMAGNQQVVRLHQLIDAKCHDPIVSGD